MGRTSCVARWPEEPARRITMLAGMPTATDPPPAPERLSVPVPDSHTHLDMVGGDPAAAVAAATAVGVDRVVQIGVDVATSRWSARVAGELPAVLAAVALHPNEAPNLEKAGELDEALRVIEGLARQDRVRAVGETGLDSYRTGDEGRDAQERSFRAH